jgi:hypothetical protein
MLLVGVLWLLAAPAAAQQPDPAPGGSAARPDPAPQAAPTSQPAPVAPAPVAPAPVAPAPVAPAPTATATPAPAPAARHDRSRSKRTSAASERHRVRRARDATDPPPRRSAPAQQPDRSPAPGAAVPLTRADERAIDAPELRAAAAALLVAAAGALALVLPLRRGLLR